MKRWRPRTKLLCLILGIVAACVAGHFAYTINTQGGAMIGSVAPPIVAQHWINTPDDGPPEARPGSQTLVLFWAQWCPFCAAAMPKIIDLQNDETLGSLRIITIHDRREGSLESVRQAVLERELTFSVGVDLTNEASRAFGVSGIPHAFLIDSEGVCVWDGSPLAWGFSEQIRKAMEAR